MSPDLAPDRERIVSQTHADACALLELGRIHDAEAIGRQLRDWGWRSRYPTGRGYGLHIEALAAAARGRARKAAELLEASIALTRGHDPCGILSWQLAELAAAKASLGMPAVHELLRAADAADQAARQPPRSARLLAHAHALACVGRIDQATANLAALVGESAASTPFHVDALTLLARIGVCRPITERDWESPLTAVRARHIKALTDLEPHALLAVSDSYAQLEHWHLAAEVADAAVQASFRRGDTGGQRAAARRDELLVECETGPLPWWSTAKIDGAA